MSDPSVSDATDAALAVLVARRDERALEQVYRRHAGPMLHLATRVLRDSALAEEVVQEVLLRLWAKPERFDAGRGSLRAFLLADAHGRCVDMVRADEARRRRETADGRRALAPVANAVESEALATLAAEGVRRAIGVLPPAEREALELAYLDGHSYREVARLLDEPEGTVKSRIRAALNRLRGTLEPSEVNEA